MGLDLGLGLGLWLRLRLFGLWLILVVCCSSPVRPGWEDCHADGGQDEEDPQDGKGEEIIGGEFHGEPVEALRGELDAPVGSLDEEEGRKGEGHQSGPLEAVG